jgi:hypothetical protein
VAGRGRKNVHPCDSEEGGREEKVLSWVSGRKEGGGQGRARQENAKRKSSVRQKRGSDGERATM